MRSRQRLISIVAILILAVSLPVTLAILKLRQQTRSQANVECALPLDIMLVIDTSTSMSTFPTTGEKKIDGAVTAATNFISHSLIDSDLTDQKFDQDRVGIAYFNNGTGILQGLTDNKSAVQAGINGLKGTVVTGTRIHAGIQTGMTELLAKQQPGRAKILVLLTDGLINPSPEERSAACQGQNPVTDPTKCEDFNVKYLYPVADQAKAAGIRVMTIGFGKLEGEGGDTSGSAGIFRGALERAATTPQDFFYAPDNQALEGVFQTLSSITHVCECEYQSIVEIRDATTDTVLTDGTGYQTTSQITAVNGTKTGPSVLPIKAEDGKARITWDVLNLPENLQSVNNAVKLTQLPTGYEIVDTFCFETKIDLEGGDSSLAKGCPAEYADSTLKAHGPKTNLFSNFTLSCDRAITYGWRVKPSTTVRPKLVCAQGACIESTNQNDTRKSCSAKSSGVVAECQEGVCTAQNTCAVKPIEQITSADKTCDTAADCVKPKHKECKESACTEVDGPGKDMCASAADCSVSVCTSAQTCVPTAREDVRDEDVICTANTDCIVRNVCHNFACVEERSAGVNECDTNSDCLITYKTCENLACVEKTGDKEDTCSDDTECYKSVCDDNTNACISIADTSADPDECVNNDDCAIPQHRACVDVSCQLVDGEGENTCDTSGDCSRNVCRNQACVAVADTGDSPDECTTSQDCVVGTPLLEKHLSCVNDACIEVSGPGNNTCSNREDCIQRICKDEACVETTNSQGTPDECTTNEQCAQPTYQTCLNESCVTLNGSAPSGTRLCTSNADCAAPPIVEAKTYKTCLNQSCVVVAGVPAAGVQLCDSNAECVAPAPPMVPDTGISGGALIATITTLVLALFGLRLFL